MAVVASGGGKPGEAKPAGSETDCPPDPCTKVPWPVLAVALVWLAVLVALFFLYERDAAFANFVAFKLGRLPFEAIWFGAVGGFLISSQGIFKHNREWHRSYDYWHYARPILGAISGTLGCLVFIVLTEAATKKTAEPNPVFYDVIALAIGYREESFRTLIAKLFDTLILPGKDESKKPGPGGEVDATPQGDEPKPSPNQPQGPTEKQPPAGALTFQLFTFGVAIAALVRSFLPASRQSVRFRR